MVGSATARALDRRSVGIDVELVNRTKVGDDDYGPNYDDTTDSPHTIRARVERDTEPEIIRDRSGAEVRIDANVYIKDDTAAVNDGLEGGGHKGSSRVIAHGETYVVLQVDDQASGLLRLQTRRKD